MALEDALPTLLILAIAMLCLAWLSRQLSVRTQLVVYYATGSIDLATLAIFLLLLPGVFVHELSHWVAAKVLGLRTSKFRVWPKRHKDRIGLGSVSVERGGTWRDSAVGMAPLITGSVLLALVGAAVFQSDLMLEQLAQGRLLDTVGAFFDALAKPDGLVWAYFLFVIGNSMMPSRSDRQPLRLLLIYIALAALIYIVVGLPIEPLTALLGWLIPAIQLLVGALLFVILLDVFVVAGLFLLEAILARLEESRDHVRRTAAGHLSTRLCRHRLGGAQRDTARRRL